MKSRLKGILVGVGLVGMVGATIIGYKWNRVVRVIDGDTMVLGNRQEVRLLGIDAPEVGRCGAEEAKVELEKSVLEKIVSLTELKTDKYGRIMALVYDGKSLINEKMLLSGWARWDGTNNNLGSKLRLASDEARKKKVGVYGNCRINGDKECVIKGNVEKRSGVTKGGRKLYFFPGCSEYEAVVVEKELGEDWFCSEAEAVRAGYSLASNCFDKTYK